MAVPPAPRYAMDGDRDGLALVDQNDRRKNRSNGVRSGNANWSPWLRPLEPSFAILTRTEITAGFTRATRSAATRSFPLRRYGLVPRSHRSHTSGRCENSKSTLRSIKPARQPWLDGCGTPWSQRSVCYCGTSKTFGRPITRSPHQRPRADQAARLCRVLSPSWGWWPVQIWSAGGNVARLLAFQDLVDDVGDFPADSRKVHPIGHEPSVFDEHPRWVGQLGTRVLTPSEIGTSRVQRSVMKLPDA